MKKIKIYIIAAVIIALSSTAAWAFGIVRDNIIQDKITKETQSIVSDDIKTLNDNESYLIDFASRYDISTPLSEREYNQISDYYMFISQNNLTADEISYINELLDEGITLYTVIGAYNFYLTTSEDFSIIGDIARREDDFFGTSWIEEVFNSITNNKCGAIETREELQEYYDKDFTTDDIQTANILCRKGVKTIHEILDMKLTQDWPEIINYIYSQCDSKYVSVTKNYGTGLNQLKSVDIANKYSDIDIEKIASKDTIIDTAGTIEKERYLGNLSAVKEKMESLNITKIDSVELSEEEQKELYNRAVESGCPRSVIMTLLSRGYTYQEIIDAAILASEQGVLPTKTIKLLNLSGGENQ